ncbi:MAG: hypothetical protein MAG581_00301 [Deltaproteobacteria bacterium]|jgi:hypothetical protein|nr:hypothetical protein [Deltaproteobacteria bacterium]
MQFWKVKLTANNLALDIKKVNPIGEKIITYP